MTEDSVLQKIKYIFDRFTLTERILFWFLSVLVIFSGYFLIANFISKNYFVEVPIRGGIVKEGEIGTPRFINPLLAVSETDRDLTSLIYSGLMRKNDEGEIIPDLALKVEISEDGLQYKFILKDDITFHDNKKITADDVIFTVNKTKDFELKSPKRSNWEGIQVEKIDDKTILFTLSKQYPSFLQITTLGILPKHIWDGIESSEFSLSIFNIEPIGSGPFMIEKINRDEIGIPVSYVLKSFNRFALGEAYLEKIEFIFAKSESDLVEKMKNKEINAIHGISPEFGNALRLSDFNVQSTILPRIFGVFFNQVESSVLASRDVRVALNMLIPRQEIIRDVLLGYGEEIFSTIPLKFLNNDEILQNKNFKNQEERIEEARKILENAGWKKNEDGIYFSEKNGDKKLLSFNLTTADIQELVFASQKMVDVWNNFGAKVELKTFPINEFTQNIIRTRKFDATLFGIIISKEIDLYAFWHSSQRNDPGLNISQYANIKTDSLLEKIRTLSSKEDLFETLISFEKEIQKDVPAIFIYSPKFIYVFPNEIKGVNFDQVISTEERFSNIYKWYIKTDKVLKLFVKS